jgi:hypothetical protein
MAVEDKIQYAFTAGEVSDAYANRSDLAKYDLGLRKCLNFIVDPQGGIKTRVGSEIVGLTKDADQVGKLVRFRGTVTDTLLLFGDGYMRVIQNGGYVLEDASYNMTVTDDNPILFTYAAHGYSNGDWIYVEAPDSDVIDQQYLIVKNATANDFKVTDVFGADVNFLGTGGASVSATVTKVYERNTPYAGEDLPSISFEQNLNTVRITSVDYKRRVLTFNAANDWDLNVVNVSEGLAAPTNVALTPSAAGDVGVAVVVTAVDRDGNESLPSDYALEQSSVNYSVTEGNLNIECDPVPGAVRYNFYRSLLVPGSAEVTKGEQLGFIGYNFGPTFNDNNITPDFTKAPPTRVDPFAQGAITFIEVTAGGSGYAKSDTVSVSGGGSGFDGYPIVSDSGSIIGISIVNGGSGYSAPVTVTIGTSGGTGATFDVEIGPDAGTNPKLFKIFQRRGIYFASESFPVTLWASRPKELDNYDTGSGGADDPYTFDIDSVTVKPIKHVVVLRNGLLIFTDDGVTQILAESGRAINAGSAVAEPQLYVDVSDTPPLLYNLDVLFTTEDSTTLYAMLYTEYTESFKLQELSILASHLIGPSKEITRMVSAQLPANTIYMPRSDGRELTMTYIRDQDVYAFAVQETQGYYFDTEVIRENDVPTKYQLVRRYLRGKYVNVVERVPVRKDDLVEDYWGVDCGLKYGLREGIGSLTFDGASGEAVATISGSVFSPSQIGDIIYVAGGKFRIDNLLSSLEATGTWLRPASDVLPQKEGGLPTPAASRTWEIGTPTTVVSGLWHLEGETVSVCADGNAYLDVTVTNGKITLEHPATKIYVGLPYVCDFSSLPLTSNQLNVNGKPKRLHTVFPRLQSSRGMKFGTSFDYLVEMKERTDEAWGEEIALITDITELLLSDTMSLSQYFVGRQEYPLPATILGYTVEMDFGDTG